MLGAYTRNRRNPALSFRIEPTRASASLFVVGFSRFRTNTVENAAQLATFGPKNEILTVLPEFLSTFLGDQDFVD